MVDRSRSKRTPVVCVGVVLLAALLACSDGQPQSDLEPIRAADEAYATAWLTNDPEQVLATLTEDVVLTPSGLPTIEGAEAARRFWWPPDSPTTTVTAFVLDPRLVGGDGDQGFVRGTFVLEFVYDGKAVSSRGSYTTRLRLSEDGRWKIYERSWIDEN